MALWRTKTSPDPAPDQQGRRPSSGLRATSIWLIACLLIFLWWASTYGGLVEYMAEWQFTHFGRYFPSLTVGFAVLILGTPLAALVGWYRRRQRLRSGQRASSNLPLIRLELAIHSAARSFLFFMALGSAAMLVAAGVFLSILWLPAGSGPVRTISGVEGSVQPEGAAAFAKPYRLGRVARIEENVGLARRVLYVAPVYLSREHDEEGFLTTVLPSATPPLRFRPIASGVLVERGLPQELVNLYHAAAVPIPQRAYLLMQDETAVRWRSLVLGIQTALLAIVALLWALVLRHQMRRLRQLLAKETTRVQT